MDGTRELVDAGQVGVLLAVLSGLCLLLAPLSFSLYRRRKPSGAAWLKSGLLALVGLLVFPLWLVYNAIEDALGLDSVAALLINLALFVGIGGVVGLAMRRFWPAESEG
jgi:uncharacterized membrane protein